MKIMQCKDYLVISSNNTLKIFLQKKDLVKSNEEFTGGIFSLKKNIKSSNVIQPDINFNIALEDLNDKVSNTLNTVNGIQIIVCEGDKIIQVFDAKLLELI